MVKKKLLVLRYWWITDMILGGGCPIQVSGKHPGISSINLLGNLQGEYKYQYENIQNIAEYFMLYNGTLQLKPTL